MSDVKVRIDNINVSEVKPLITPAEIKELLPISRPAFETVFHSRQHVANILMGKENRIFLIVGPCSIHDAKAALEYAEKLKGLAEKIEQTIFVVMRTYFEKPRTTVGWKGYINDPHLDHSFDMNEGLKLARKLLLTITESNLPVATEALEPISPQYFSELVSWTAIGARTTESQTHRELASGLSSPVGFKNNTDGNIEVAMNAMKSSASPHHFLGIDPNGSTSIISTKGNPHTHLILRGGKNGPNYDRESVVKTQKKLEESSLNPKIVIDCSHDNSRKDYRAQPEVFMDCIDQIIEGNQNICGLMLESHLNEGNQSISEKLDYGKSITDGCISFETTEEILLKAHERLMKAKKNIAAK